MNPFCTAVLGGIARAAVASAGGYAVAKGTLTADELTQMGGAACVAVAGVWSVWQKFRR